MKLMKAITMVALIALWGCEPTDFLVLDVYAIDATQLILNTDNESVGFSAIYDDLTIYTKSDDVSKLLYPLFRANIKYMHGTHEFDVTCDITESMWTYLNKGMVFQSSMARETPPPNPCSDFRDAIEFKWRRGGNQE